MNNNEYVLSCTSCWDCKRIIDKYPVLKNYNTRIDYPFPNVNAARIIIEVEDLRKLYDDIKEEIIISKEMGHSPEYTLEIYDDYRE